MFTHNLTYKNFNDKVKTTDVSFHMTPADVAKLDHKFKDHGGFKGVLDLIEKNEGGDIVVLFFEEMIELSYGIKSADGEQFDRTTVASFIESAQYDQFFMELMSVEGMAADFFNGVIPEIPEEVTDSINAQIAASKASRRTNHPRQDQ